MEKCMRWWSVQVSSAVWLYFTLLLAEKIGSSVCPAMWVGSVTCCLSLMLLMLSRRLVELESSVLSRRKLRSPRRI